MYRLHVFKDGIMCRQNNITNFQNKDKTQLSLTCAHNQLQELDLNLQIAMTPLTKQRFSN